MALLWSLQGCLSKETPNFGSLRHSVAVVAAAVPVLLEVVASGRHLMGKCWEGISGGNRRGKLCRRGRCLGGCDFGGRG